MAVTTPTTAAGQAAPSPLRVGVVVWLASELMFFAGLFAAYYMLRSENAGHWPPSDVELDTIRANTGDDKLTALTETFSRAVFFDAPLVAAAGKIGEGSPNADASAGFERGVHSVANQVDQ